MDRLVSIIIPCFNAEKYISECIDSVLRQTYKNIEIICVDNNSTDKTAQILNSYSEKITILKELKPGAPNARNTGLENAKGEWIQFLDADDIILPAKIESQIALLCKSNAAFIVGNYLTKQNGKTENITQIKNSWEGLIKGRLGFTSSNLWKKSALEKVGGWDNIKSSQEAYLMFKILKLNEEVLFDDEFNTIKIELNNSISHTNVKENIIRYIELRVAVWDYLKETNKLSDYILEVLKINIFDSIRILYSENKDAGIKLYSEIVKDKFEPIKSSSTSVLYLFLYKMLGFKMTQKLLG